MFVYAFTKAVRYAAPCNFPFHVNVLTSFHFVDETYYVQMTSTEQVCPLDSLLRVTQGDLVLTCPVSSLPTHSWEVASLHSFGTSGPQLWLQECGTCNEGALPGPVYLTVGSGVSTCEDIFHQVCNIVCGNGALTRTDSASGQRICHISTHEGHEHHALPPPACEQGRAVLLTRTLSPETVVSNSSVSDDKYECDSGVSTRSNSGILTPTTYCPSPHTSARRQGSLPSPSQSAAIQRLRKGSLPLLDYPVLSVSCGSLDTFNRIAEDELLPPKFNNADPEDVFVFMPHPPLQRPPRTMPSSSFSSDSLTQMMKNTKASNSMGIKRTQTCPQRHGPPPPSPPIPPRPAETLVSTPVTKLKCPSA